MAEYVFSLRYRIPQNVQIDDIVERLGEAQLTDALPGTGIAGRLGLEFTREAATAGDAMTSAVNEVSLCLPEAILVEAGPDFAGLSDIAGSIGISRQAARKMMTAHADFPVPVHDGSTTLWHLSDVLDWLAGSRGHAVDPQFREVSKAARQVNAALEHARSALEKPAFRPNAGKVTRGKAEPPDHR